MFASLKKILGIGPSDVAAGRVKSMASRPGMFLPESKIPPGGIEAVADDGSCWEPWRRDPQTGEQWYRRLSSVEPIADSPVHGIDADLEQWADTFDPSYEATLELWERRNALRQAEADREGSDDGDQ